MAPLSPHPIALSKKISRRMDLLRDMMKSNNVPFLESSGDDKIEQSIPSLDSSSNSSSSNRSRVSFCASMQVFEIMSRRDYSEKEIGKCWFSAEKKKKMQAQYTKIVERMEKGRPPKKGMTYRGLDCLTTEGGIKFTENVHQVVDAVMDEQEAQWDRQQDDYELIARKSLAVTEKCKQRAREYALQDELEASVAWEADEEEEEEATAASPQVEERKVVESIVRVDSIVKQGDKPPIVPSKRRASKKKSKTGSSQTSKTKSPSRTRSSSPTKSKRKSPTRTRSSRSSRSPTRSSSISSCSSPTKSKSPTRSSSISSCSSSTKSKCPTRTRSSSSKSPTRSSSTSSIKPKNSTSSNKVKSATTSPKMKKKSGIKVKKTVSNDAVLKHMQLSTRQE